MSWFPRRIYGTQFPWHIRYASQPCGFCTCRLVAPQSGSPRKSTLSLHGSRIVPQYLKHILSWSLGRSVRGAASLRERADSLLRHHVWILRPAIFCNATANSTSCVCHVHLVSTRSYFRVNCQDIEQRTNESLGTATQTIVDAPLVLMRSQTGVRAVRMYIR